ncbi:M1 family metallopeptidase [Geitlerinema splendidum]|nr:M1 family metallopeptidase [Geitlerinema splendidum]
MIFLMKALRFTLNVIILVLCACRSVSATETPPPTATTLRVVVSPGTLVPTLDRIVQPIAQNVSASPAPSAAPGLTPSACPTTVTTGSAAQHTVEAELDYANRTVQVAQQTRFQNRTNQPFETIVFNFEPNRFPQVVTMESIRLNDGQPVSYELTGRRLTIEFSQPLLPGCTAALDLAFSLNIPPVGAGVNGYTGYFGYTDRQLNLAQWLPTVAVRVGGEWITHEVIGIGEQVVADTADWDLTLEVVNSPEDLRLAAPGTVESALNQWRVVSLEARDLALSLSDRFNVSSRTASNGTLVELYTFSDTLVQTDNGVVDGAVDALRWASQAIGMFSDLFGSYPQNRFVVVEGDFPDGMEFSQFVFVSDDWFRTYNGTPQSYLAIITIHEVAHQWWFNRVGSDPALTPWLDEALATYSEYIFYEEFYPELKDWWWAFRVDTFAPPSFTGAPVDSTVYQFGTIREYINAVYLRGARMLHALRSDLGTEAFFEWLRRYSDAGRGRVVSPDVLWSMLSPEQLELTAETRARYLRHAP